MSLALNLNFLNFSGWKKKEKILGKMDLLYALAAGIIGTFGFAPFSFAPLLGVSLVLLMILLRKNPSRGGFLGLMWGIGFYWSSLNWIQNSFSFAPSGLQFLKFFSPLGICIYLSLYPFLVGMTLNLLYRHRLTQKKLLFALCFATLWSIQEWCIGHFFTGFPWLLIAYTWIKILPIAQYSAFLGSYGLGLITLFYIAAIFYILPFDQEKRTPSLFSILLSGFKIFLILLIFYGMGYLRISVNPTQWDSRYRMRLVQPAIKQEEKNDLRYAYKQMSILISRSLSDFNYWGKPPTHILWPESAIPWSLNDASLQAFPHFRDHTNQTLDFILLTGGTYHSTESSLHTQIAASSSDSHSSSQPSATLPSQASPHSLNSSEASGKKVWNALLTQSIHESLKPIYFKQHLVPFGEYLPLRPLLSWLFPNFKLEKIACPGRDFSSGTINKNVELKNTPVFNALICYEAVFPDQAHSKKARWLLNITNDAWFGTSRGPYQHFTCARFRAIEQGMPLLRVANTGISAVIDPMGRILQMLPLGKEGIIDSFLPYPLNHPTLYQKSGDWPWFFLIVFSLSSICFFHRQSKNKYRQKLRGK